MKKALIATIVLTALAATSLVAQEQRTVYSPLPCPHPVTIIIKGSSSAPTPDPKDLGPTLGPASAGSQWNQTATNKHFGHTFHFPAPPRECCLMTSGTIIVKVKALQGGPAHSSSSANDAFSLVSNGVVISQQQPWNNSGVATGAVATLTFTVPQSALNNGAVSIFGQDDSAFQGADLTLRGCCLK